LGAEFVERAGIQPLDDRTVEADPRSKRAEILPVAEQYLGCHRVGPRRDQVHAAAADIETRPAVDLERRDIEPAMGKLLRHISKAVGFQLAIAEIVAVLDIAGREQIPARLARED